MKSILPHAASNYISSGPDYCFLVIIFLGSRYPVVYNFNSSKSITPSHGTATEVPNVKSKYEKRAHTFRFVVSSILRGFGAQQIILYLNKQFHSIPSLLNSTSITSPIETGAVRLEKGETFHCLHQLVRQQTGRFGLIKDAYVEIWSDIKPAAN